MRVNWYFGFIVNIWGTKSNGITQREARIKAYQKDSIYLILQSSEYYDQTLNIVYMKKQSLICGKYQ